MVAVLGIGDNTVDIYVDEGMQYPGGNAVNVAVQARRLGALSSYLGCLGNDALGRLVHESLVAEDVDVSHCRRIDGPNAWSRITHRGHDRVFAGSNPGVRMRYGLGPDDEAFMAVHDLVHTSVHSDLDAELGRIRAFAKLLSYDYSEHWARPGKVETFRHVDIAFLSFPKGSDAECQDLMSWCAAGGATTVVVTRGVRGSCARGPEGVHSEAIRPAELVDTLGAGDAFIAAFLVSYLGEQNVGAALAQGAAHAARACGYKGAFGRGIAIDPTHPGAGTAGARPAATMA